MGKTDIEWSEMVWNPVTGCTKVSSGCKNCYAERLFPRVYGNDIYLHKEKGMLYPTRKRRFTDVKLHYDRLDKPLSWKKPRMVFVNSMSDLFHEDVPFEFISSVFNVTFATNHIYQILTKRPERVLEYLKYQDKEFEELGFDTSMDFVFPENHWIGVSVEDQKTANERIPLLLEIPAKVRFLSCEPLLDPVELKIHWCGAINEDTGLREPGIDWVIVGGESGPKARLMDERWALRLKKQCEWSKIPFFFKQGSQANWKDFKNFESFPEELQIREYPR